MGFRKINSGILAIIDNYCESTSPEKMPFKIFTSRRVCPPAVNSTLQYLGGFIINFMILSGILHIFRQYIIQVSEAISLIFLLSIHDMATFFRLAFNSWKMSWSMYNKSVVPLVPVWHNFCCAGKWSAT